MSNKVAIVTGATSGIGRAAARIFRDNGYNVLAVGRNETELAALRSEAGGGSGTLETHHADVTDLAALDGIVEAAIDRYSSIAVLVNAAGIIGNGTIENTSIEDWDAMMTVNVRSVFALSQKCVPHLIASGGNIVNLSSVAGTRAFPNVLAYCVSKAAIDQLTRCSALELAGKGVRVNAVNPGVVVTNIHKRGGMADDAYENFLDHSKTTHPIGRVGTPEEVGELIYYLASEKAGWITGATYAIDGGRGQTCAR